MLFHQRQTQPGALRLVLRLGAAAAVEPPEDGHPLIGLHARAGVVHMHHQRGAVALQFHRGGATAIALGVLQEVGQHPLDPQWVHRVAP